MLNCPLPYYSLIAYRHIGFLPYLVVGTQGIKAQIIFSLNLQVFQPFASETPLFAVFCYASSQHKREASGHMKDVEACLALDEAIGQSSQGYHKWGHAAPRSRVLKIGLVALSGISASSDSRTKFLWQTAPRHRRRLMSSLKPKALEPEHKCIKKHAKQTC